MSSKTLPISIRLEKTKNWELNYISNKKEYSNIFFINLEIRNYLKQILFSKNLKFIKLFLNINNYNIYLYIYYKTFFFNFLKIKKLNFKKSFFLINFKNKKNFQIFKKYKKFFKFIILKRLKIFLFLKYLKIKFNKIYNNYFFNVFFIPLNLKNLNSKKNFLIKKKIINKYKNKVKNIFLKRISKIFFLLYLGIVLKEPFFILQIIKNFLYKQKNHKRYFQYIIKDLKKILKIYNYFLGFKLQLKGRLNGKMRAKNIWIKQGETSLIGFNKIVYYGYLPLKTRYGVFGIKIWLIYKKKKKHVN